MRCKTFLTQNSGGWHAVTVVVVAVVVVVFGGRVTRCKKSKSRTTVRFWWDKVGQSGTDR